MFLCIVIIYLLLLSGVVVVLVLTWCWVLGFVGGSAFLLDGGFWFGFELV